MPAFFAQVDPRFNGLYKCARFRFLTFSDFALFAALKLVVSLISPHNRNTAYSTSTALLVTEAARVALLGCVVPHSRLLPLCVFPSQAVS